MAKIVCPACGADIDVTELVESLNAKQKELFAELKADLEKGKATSHVEPNARPEPEPARPEPPPGAPKRGIFYD